jgi:hypothetical protein
MRGNHLKKPIMGSPHVKEFKIPFTLHKRIQTNLCRGMVSKGTRVAKVDTSESLQGRPRRVDQHPIKLTPDRPICPTKMAASKVDIMETKIRAAVTKIRGFIERNSPTIVLIG